MRTIAQCQKNLDEMAARAPKDQFTQTHKLAINQDYNYNINKLTKDYNYNGSWLFNFINTDITYAWALKAGMQGAVLFRASEAIGIDEVKRCIDMVASGPEAKRTGAYLNTVLKSRIKR